MAKKDKVGDFNFGFNVKATKKKKTKGRGKNYKRSPTQLEAWQRKKDIGTSGSIS